MVLGSIDSVRGRDSCVNGTAVSLFSGAGGLDLGVKLAGFETRVAVEWDPHAVETMRRNAKEHFPGLNTVVEGDLFPLANGRRTGIRTRDILNAGGFEPRERPDLLIGGPPCVAFSKSGYWLKWKREGTDPAASLLQAYTTVLRQARPRFFILENVPALTFNNRASQPAFERLLKEVKDAGYHSHWKLLNAADFGVPQARARLFIVGSRNRKQLPSFPRATHWDGVEAPLGSDPVLPHVTSGEALKGLSTQAEPGEEFRGKWAHLLPEVPPGGNYLHFTERRGHPDPKFEWRSRYWSYLLKLDPNRPAPTIQARPGSNIGPFHWDNRRLRVPELKRLFTFPDNFEFVGKRTVVQSQLGNSVPPLLAQRVAEQIG